MMSSHEIRKRFLDFFAYHAHTILPSAPLIPHADGGDRALTLFNVAGMQPLMPYLLGQAHPDGKRLANSQMCIRTIDIDEVGDNTHATFFEMLGNWSLGDYYKAESIAWSYAFLTDTERGLGLDPARLYVTVFAGNDVVPRDDEAVAIWKQYIPEHRIYFRDEKDNWWTAGPDSPAGPSTEMFYDLTPEGLGDMDAAAFERADEQQHIVEVWNNVFMAYRQEGGIVVAELPHKNVDTGAGLERLTSVVQGVRSIYDTDLFQSLIDHIGLHTDLAQSDAMRRARIIADHTKAACFLIAEGLVPSSQERGYILRRLIRRALAHAYRLGIHNDALDLITLIVEMYSDAYPLLAEQRDTIRHVWDQEKNKFSKTLDKGIHAFEKGERDAFTLFTTYGFPLEMTKELAAEKGEYINEVLFAEKMQAHQDASRQGAAQAFKGGLANTDDPRVIALHTAHHLLLAALQQVLGASVVQKGSNITEERLRIDFAYDQKMTDEQKQTVSELVQQWIHADLPVTSMRMPKTQAEALGAQMEFGQKYPDEVTVYFIGDPDHAISKEFCGGPHVDRTGVLGTFRILKEEASSQGVRRIKAVLA